MVKNLKHLFKNLMTQKRAEATTTMRAKSVFMFTQTLASLNLSNVGEFSCS